MRNRDIDPMNRRTAASKAHRHSTSDNHETEDKSVPPNAPMRSENAVRETVPKDRQQTERQVQAPRRQSGGALRTAERPMASRGTIEGSAGTMQSGTRRAGRGKGTPEGPDLKATGGHLEAGSAHRPTPSGNTSEPTDGKCSDCGTSPLDPKSYWEGVHKQLRWDARSAARSMRYSPTLDQMDDPKAFEKITSKALDDYLSGRFLVEHFGADRLLDPATTGMLLGIRRGLIEEIGATTVSEMVLIDMAVIAFANAMRVQSMVGNISLILEGELFGQPTLNAIWNREHSQGRREIKGLSVDRYVAQLRDELLPLMERFQSAARANLDAISRQRDAPSSLVERARPIPIIVRNLGSSTCQSGSARATSSHLTNRDDAAQKTRAKMG